MRKSFLALAGALIGGAMLASPSKAAVVKVTDLGALPLDTSLYFGTSGAGSFSNYFKFELGSALTDASVTFSDSVKPNKNPALPSPLLITGGTLALYSCATNCTGGTLAPTGSLLDSTALINTGLTTQGASFGPGLLSTAGYYYLLLSGIAPVSSVTYTGTITLSSAVPEPATWAMMLAGFGGLAFAGMRRRKTVGAAV